MSAAYAGGIWLDDDSQLCVDMQLIPELQLTWELHASSTAATGNNCNERTSCIVWPPGGIVVRWHDMFEPTHRPSPVVRGSLQHSRCYGQVVTWLLLDLQLCVDWQLTIDVQLTFDTQSTASVAAGNSCSESTMSMRSLTCLECIASEASGDDGRVAPGVQSQLVHFADISSAAYVGLSALIAWRRYFARCETMALARTPRSSAYTLSTTYPKRIDAAFRAGTSKVRTIHFCIACSDGKPN